MTKKKKTDSPVSEPLKPEPIEKCEICDDPCDPASVSSCDCCGRTICEDCREFVGDEGFCPSCYAYQRQCKNCACSLSVEGGSLCGNPDASSYFGGVAYYQYGCEDWKQPTADSSRDTLRRIGPIVGNVRSFLHGICQKYTEGPGSKDCKGHPHVVNGKKVGCVAWDLCKLMKSIDDGEWK